MSEEQRYDDEQGSDLPLPDVNKAWQKMGVLLDEDERRRRVLPWWFWRTATVALALLGVLAGGWWWLQPTGKEQKKKTILVKKNEQQTADAQEPTTAANVNKKGLTEKATSVQPSASPNETNVANLVTPTLAAPTNATSTSATPTIKKPASPQAQRKHQATNGIVSAKTKRLSYDKRKKGTSRNLAASLPPVKKWNSDKAEETKVVNRKDANVALRTEASGKDSAQQKPLPRKDNTVTKDSAKAVAPPVVQADEKKKVTKKKSLFVFSAGIGLQQAIALQHQPASPVDSGGRKKPFFDYYPSVYVKVQRGKWAAQMDAQYSVPQPIAGFSFSQKTTYDATAGVLETARINLQKLYYHQLSLSLNYHVLPQWSVGVGGVYNLFAGAVTERELTSKYASTGVEVVDKYTEPIKGYKDSFFYKTTASLLLQTDYHWKRFSLGLRYTQNLQPFIKYTEPNGNVMDKKNNALQAVLRFRLWRSR